MVTVCRPPYFAFGIPELEALVCSILFLPIQAPDPAAFLRIEGDDTNPGADDILEDKTSDRAKLEAAIFQD